MSHPRDPTQAAAADPSRGATGPESPRQWPASRRRWAPLLLLLVLAIPTLVTFNRPLIRGDGVAYLAWVDTLVLDQDLDFGNQLERLRPVNTYQITWSDQTQKLVNVFPFGVAILQAPFYLLGHLFLQLNWWNPNPDYFYQMQGLGAPYSFWLMIGANLMALGALISGWFVARRLTDDWTAAVTAWAFLVGTPLIYYSTVSPLNSHNPGAFLMALFVWLLAWATGFAGRPAPGETIWPWLLMGLVAGLMVLVRWQLLLVVLAAALLLLSRRRRRETVVLLAVALIAALPLPAVWQWMFGRPLVVPYEAVEGRQFLDLLNIPTYGLRVLWDTLRHSPILLLALAGIPMLWRRDRGWTLFAVGAIVLEGLLNGTVLDWWAGETYGMRRMTELYPLYVLLAGAALAPLKHEAGAHPLPDGRSPAGAFWVWAARVLLVALTIYSLLYLLVFINYTWTNPDQVFITDPGTMWRYFLDQTGRWRITAEVMRAHVGPPAWSLPGP